MDDGRGRKEEPKILGGKEYTKWTTGKLLTRKEAMLANCYQCNGFEDSSEDCLGETCPMYQYHPYRGR